MNTVETVLYRTLTAIDS